MMYLRLLHSLFVVLEIGRGSRLFLMFFLVHELLQTQIVIADLPTLLFYLMYCCIVVLAFCPFKTIAIALWSDIILNGTPYR